MINTKRFTFKGNKLYFGKRDTFFSVYNDPEGMWRVCYPQKDLSNDHYNLTWAKHHCISEAAKSLGVQLEQAERVPSSLTDASFTPSS